jgi:hypothetical protein
MDGGNLYPIAQTNHKIRASDSTTTPQRDLIRVAGEAEEAAEAEAGAELGTI